VRELRVCLVGDRDGAQRAVRVSQYPELAVCGCLAQLGYVVVLDVGVEWTSEARWPLDDLLCRQPCRCLIEDVQDVFYLVWTGALDDELGGLRHQHRGSSVLVFNGEHELISGEGVRRTSHPVSSRVGGRPADRDDGAAPLDLEESGFTPGRASRTDEVDAGDRAVSDVMQ
jgi:hypothetical protein